MYIKKQGSTKNADTKPFVQNRTASVLFAFVPRFFIYLFSICFLSCFSIICFYKIKNFIKTNYRKTSKLYIKVSKKTQYIKTNGTKNANCTKNCGGCVAVWRGRSHSTLEWSGYAPATQPHSHRAVRLCGYAARPLWQSQCGGGVASHANLAKPNCRGWATPPPHATGPSKNAEVVPNRAISR